MYPSCHVVPPDVMAQVARAQQLIRPSEVQQFVQAPNPYQALLGPLPPLADQVSRLFKHMFAYRQLQYIPDPTGMDLWCSPAATLQRGGGDCDDLGLLAASMFYAAGLRVGAVIGTRQSEGHFWVIGQDEAGPFWFEATNGDVHRNILVARLVEGYKPRLLVTPDDWSQIN